MNNQGQEFIENDLIGEHTLDVIANANKFNRWMYETIKPYCRGNILEVGSGLGSISKYFVKDNLKIQLTDIRARYCSKLEEKFGDHPNVLGIESMDLIDDDFDNKFSRHFNKYKTVFALNVIEHISIDVKALENCYKLLISGGKLIILVPSYQSLFNKFDTELGHYRRYNKTSLSDIFVKSGYNIIHKQHFNFIGIFGWYFSGKILKRESIPSGQMKLYNMFVPIFKIIDKFIRNSVGLSTIVVGEKI
jgi:SAM-dependent methyltransferase